MGAARRRRRRAISSIVATVIIIALTLVASYATSRFVFGVSPAMGNASQVSVTRASIAAADFKSSFTGTRFNCGSPASSYLTISNTGTVAETVISVTLAWAGLTNRYTLSGTCTIGGLGSGTSTQNVLFYAGATQVLNTDAIYGGTFTGTVTMDNGAVLPYSGTFY
ncbi:MAG TPA: archaellin/type IV pilin N-terminal domain-containing protein [Nitrososphaerales archaeon]|nr:archaellin/type IV pilin N-terminal domain-containing protein [Nitrososphaerales archaeon]